MTSAGDGTDGQPPQASAWNIANALTISRLALVPVFAWFLLHDGGTSTNDRLLAASVFVVATATDHIDGAIARAKGLVTDFGKVSDPIADKALMGMALVGLSIIGLLSWWVTVVVVVREIGITALRFVVIRHGVIPASGGGKVKTALQALAILLYVLPLSDAWHSIAVVTMGLAVIVTVATGVDYLMRAHILRNTSPRAQANRERRAAAAGKAAAAARAAAARAAAARAAAAEATAARVAAAEATATEAKATGPKATDAAATGAKATDAAARHTAGPEV